MRFGTVETYPAHSLILRGGGFALVRLWIQTPSVAKVRSATIAEGEVVLGASPPARPRRAGGPTRPHGQKTARPPMSAAQALQTRPADFSCTGLRTSVSVRFCAIR